MALLNKTQVAQAGRFGRLFVLTFLPQLALVSGHLTRDVVVAAAVAAAEVAFRAVFPA